MVQQTEILLMIVTGYKNIFAALLTGCIFLCSCENDPAVVKDLNKKSLGVEEATKVDINYTTGGNAKAKLLAAIMLRVQDTVPYVEFPKKLHVDFYDSTAIVESILDAKYGRYNEFQSRILLKDSVRFLGYKNGDTLYTNELYWDRNRGTYQFYTTAPVQIRSKDRIINCVGLEISQDFKQKLFLGVSNSVFRVPASQFPTN